MQYLFVVEAFKIYDEQQPPHARSAARRYCARSSHAYFDMRRLRNRIV